MVDVWNGAGWEKYTTEECQEYFRATTPIDFTKVDSVYIIYDRIRVVYKSYNDVPEESPCEYRQNTCSGVWVRL